jgi:hypothetical protein
MVQQPDVRHLSLAKGSVPPADTDGSAHSAKDNSEAKPKARIPLAMRQPVVGTSPATSAQV